MLTMQRVLLAVYRLSGCDGMCCWATNARLSAEAGRSVETTLSALRELHRGGLVAVVDSPRLGKAHRAIVLTDHPDAALWLARLKRGRATAPDII